MLNCIYHVIDDMRVVEDEERERLVATGYWFDSPREALNAREKMEKEMSDAPKKKRSKKEMDS